MFRYIYISEKYYGSEKVSLVDPSSPIRCRNTWWHRLTCPRSWKLTCGDRAIRRATADSCCHKDGLDRGHVDQCTTGGSRDHVFLRWFDAAAWHSHVRSNHVGATTGPDPRTTERHRIQEFCHGNQPSNPTWVQYLVLAIQRTCRTRCSSAFVFCIVNFFIFFCLAIAHRISCWRCSIHSHSWCPSTTFQNMLIFYTS
jgi:hypothetical protein